LRCDDRGNEFIERLSMKPESVRLGRLNSGAPFLDTHDSTGLSSVIGAVVAGSAKIENGKGVATIKLSSAASDADTVLKIKEGIIKNVSCGYWIYATERTEGDNGKLDIVTATDWEPIEVSAVPIPADPGAQIRSANSRRRPHARQTPAQRGAAEATRLMQSHQSSAQARGASEARKALGTIGRMETVGKVGKINRREVEKGAAEARKLLRK
jgi:phage head maturation protease